MRLRTLALAFFLQLFTVLATAQDGLWTPRHVEAVRGVGAIAMSPDGTRVAYTLGVPRKAGKDDDGANWSELRVLDTADGRER
ncbi:MAG: S9 family peptidase, partial [Planctomycetota bacterium]|nr:S9 family peptidase [Planctomycetota bacterium]